MFEFSFLKKEQFPEYAVPLFAILDQNMSAIAPTGRSREEDFSFWVQAMEMQLKNERRSVILIFYRPSHEIVGYFQYSVADGVFFMEDIQFKPEYHGKYNIFRDLYGFVFDHIEEKFEFVEAYANKKNEKSMGVLKHLGLAIVGENRNGRSYRFRGRQADLMKWYKGRGQ